jgi:AsmA protein
VDNLSGSTGFAVTDSTLDVGIIKQVFTAIAALSPSGAAIQQWPDVIRFDAFTGYAIFEEGLRQNQQVKLRLDNFDITGSGGLDIEAGAFDYDLLFTVLGDPHVQTIPIGTQYHDVSWPVLCNARLDDPINRYCRPDLEQVRELFVQIAANRVPSRLEEIVEDETPEAEQGSGRGLLRNLFRRFQ